MLKQLVVRNKLIVVMVAALIVLCFAALVSLYGRAKPTIKIGILHSLTGTMVSSEKPLVDALDLAIEEANAAGGINGQQIEALVVDCRSETAYCAQQAERLIVEEKVSALFGCWTSACRKALKPVVEKYKHLLFYPAQHEGMEQSPNIIYTGAAPNQQLIPGTRWALENLGKRVYLVGSDSVFARMSNIIIKDMLTASGGVLLGEHYMPPGAVAMDAVAADIRKQRPDVVLNTLSGGSNFAFFNALSSAGISADEIPVLSFGIAEAELASMITPLTAGHYAVWNYFQSLPSPQNQAFVSSFRKRFGRQAVLDDPMEASYIGLKLWVQAAREAGSAEPVEVQRTILHQTLHAPEGMVAVDPENRHLWKTPRVGRIRPDGQFDIVWDGGNPVEPAPFPGYRLRDEWGRLLQSVEEGRP